MHPITHLLGSWCLAEFAGLDARDRALVTAAGVVPDIDGLGILAETATSGWPEPLAWWSEYHHVLCHNVGFAMLVAGIVALAAVRRAKTVVLRSSRFISISWEISWDPAGPTATRGRSRTCCRSPGAGSGAGAGSGS